MSTNQKYWDNLCALQTVSSISHTYTFSKANWNCTASELCVMQSIFKN